jgi:hypothetical protein
MLKSSWHPQKWYGVHDAYHAIRDRAGKTGIWPVIARRILPALLEFAREDGEEGWHSFNNFGDLRRNSNWYGGYPCPEHRDRLLWARRTGTRHCRMIQIEDFFEWFIAQYPCCICDRPAHHDVARIGGFLCRECQSYAWRLWQCPDPELIKIAVAGWRFSDLIMRELANQQIYAGLDSMVDEGRVKRGLRSMDKAKETVASARVQGSRVAQTDAAYHHERDAWAD